MTELKGEYKGWTVEHDGGEYRGHGYIDRVMTTINAASLSALEEKIDKIIVGEEKRLKKPMPRIPALRHTIDKYGKIKVEMTELEITSVAGMKRNYSCSFGKPDSRIIYVRAGTKANKERREYPASELLKDHAVNRAALQEMAVLADKINALEKSLERFADDDFKEFVEEGDKK